MHVLLVLTYFADIGKPDPIRGCYIKKPDGKPNACPFFRYISHSFDGGDTWPVSWWAYELVCLSVPTIPSLLPARTLGANFTIILNIR
eukprot:SAG22_NODE_2515_length_2488_cov_3.426957_2_plen_88_part_00